MPVKGKCTKCGQEYAGWALKQPEYQTCKCGGKLEVTEGGKK